MHTRIKAAIVAAARTNPTEEVCGFVYADPFGRAEILPCANVAADRTCEFEIDVRDHVTALTLGTLLGVYHSHPGEPSGFSPADLEAAQELGLPLYLVNTQDASWHDYVPPSFTLAIDGIPWVLGLRDCWELPRIHYRQTLGIYLSDYDRDETFLDTAQSPTMADTTLASYEREGFDRLAADPAALRVHDILLFRTGTLPQHFGVFRGDSRFTHHVQNALSRTEHLTDRWMSRLHAVFRHRSLVAA